MENRAPTTSLFHDYQLLHGVYDEFFIKNNNPHPLFAGFIEHINGFSKDSFLTLQHKAHELMQLRGVTYNYTSQDKIIESIFPFDLLPRIIKNEEWKIIEKGLEQRVRALNIFLDDVYHDKKIISDKIIPRELILSSSGYIEEVNSITPPGKVYIHVAGIDIIRNAQGELVVLEDNLRIPSGVSYVLENRQMMKTLLPELFKHLPIYPVENYPSYLANALRKLAAQSSCDGIAVVLTPGIYNPAYFEHAYLARTMGFPLVESHDLYMHDKKIYLRSKDGDKQVAVIYRRTDDRFLDPTKLNPDSLLGIPGLVEAYQHGSVILSNALGNGVADDKSIYPYVPKIIQYYLNETPILSQVKTYTCLNADDCKFVLDNLHQLVIKLTDMSGGYGIFIGPQASKEQISSMRDAIKQNPRHYVAQPLEELSTCPTLDSGNFQAKRVDFRPYIITTDDTWVLPGGLTRVALQTGSYIVNSSQGGGSKDTWVLAK